MPGAAQFRALAAEHAFAVDGRPGLGHITGNRVLLHAELRHPERVVDVGRGMQETDLGVGRQHQAIVDIAQVVVAGLVRRQRAAFHGEFLVDVFEFPPPLVSDHLDFQHVLVLRHQPQGMQDFLGAAGNRQVHAQHQHRHHHPRPATESAEVEFLIRHRAAALAMHEQRVADNGVHDEQQHEGDAHRKHVDIVDIAGTGTGPVPESCSASRRRRMMRARLPAIPRRRARYDATVPLDASPFPQCSFWIQARAHVREASDPIACLRPYVAPLAWDGK